MTTTTDEQEREYKKSADGTEVGRKEDLLKEYREKEPMTPAKEKHMNQLCIVVQDARKDYGTREEVIILQPKIYS